MSELIVPGHIARGRPLLDAPAPVMSCPHEGNIRHCPICGGEAGKQHALDQAIKEAAGGVPWREWFDRGNRFLAKSRELALSLGRDHPECKAAREAAHECHLLGDELRKIEDRETATAQEGAQDARGPSETNDLTRGMVKVPVGVDLAAEARNHEVLAHRMKQEKGLNHPDTQRHLKAARRLIRLAKKQTRRS